jgi:hypothetical protein
MVTVLTFNYIIKKDDKVKNKVIFIIVIIIFLSGCTIKTVENKAEQEIISKNENILRKNILEKCNEYRTLDLIELATFEWDKVYFFKPYASKEDVYKKVGYKWDNISEVSSEDMMQIVFMNNAKVVCYIFGGPGYGAYEPFIISSKNEELYFDENPKFIVTYISKENINDENKNGFPILEWYDQKMIETPPIANISNNLIGKWNSTIFENGEIGTYKKFNFLVTNDGIVTGYIVFDAYKKDVFGSKDVGNGSIEFIGSFDGKIAHCKTFSPQQIIMSNIDENPNKKELIKFEISYIDSKFVTSINFGDIFMLNNGKPINVDGKYSFKKIE